MELYDQQLGSERCLLGGQQNMCRPMRLGYAAVESPRKSWEAASVKSAAVYSESAVVMLRRKGEDGWSRRREYVRVLCRV